MKRIPFSIKLDLLPRVYNTFRAALKQPLQVNISPAEIISLYGSDKLKSFISIGANDGVKNDHLNSFIFKNNWQGILIEPMPDNFSKLKENFKGRENIFLENIGISETTGVLDFYYIKDISDDEPDWYDQVGSFSREIFYKNISVVPSLLERTGVIQIPTERIENVLERNGFKNIDLIMIDTEGYDYKILRSIDISRVNPKIIIFEYEWLTNYETKEALKLLQGEGYRTVLNGIDCIAIK